MRQNHLRLQLVDKDSDIEINRRIMKRIMTIIHLLTILLIIQILQII